MRKTTTEYLDMVEMESEWESEWDYKSRMAAEDAAERGDDDWMDDADYLAAQAWFELEMAEMHSA